MARAFASTAVTGKKQIRLQRLTANAYAYCEEGDPTSGIVIGDDAVLVIDARATPVAARQLVRRVRTVTDKPIRYVLLSHYHAVRVLGASAYRGAEIIASNGTLELIRERGKQDWRSEVQRFPRLFQRAESVPGLTWPTLTFERELNLHLGKLEVQIRHLGGGHTHGDTVAWLPRQKVLFAGDLVENGATPYCGDAQLSDWPRTLDRLRALEPKKLVPGRGRATTTAARSRAAIDGTEAFVRALLRGARAAVRRGDDLGTAYARLSKTLERRFGDWEIFDHCLPFNVSRAYDEASGITHPRIWTAKRDVEMWRALEGS